MVLLRLKMVEHTPPSIATINCGYYYYLRVWLRSDTFWFESRLSFFISELKNIYIYSNNQNLFFFFLFFFEFMCFYHTLSNLI